MTKQRSILIAIVGLIVVGFTGKIQAAQIALDNFDGSSGTGWATTSIWEPANKCALYADSLQIDKNSTIARSLLSSLSAYASVTLSVRGYSSAANSLTIACGYGAATASIGTLNLPTTWPTSATSFTLPGACISYPGVPTLKFTTPGHADIYRLDDISIEGTPKPTPTPTPTPTQTPTQTPTPTPTPTPMPYIQALVTNGNGEISPTDAHVALGGKKTFRIYPFPGNIIENVKLNASSVYANVTINSSSKVGTYVWTSTGNATLSASFEPNPLQPVQVTCTITGAGTCTASVPLPFTLYENKTIYLTFAASTGKTITDITLNGTTILTATNLNKLKTRATYNVKYSPGDKNFAVTFINDPTPDMNVTATATNGVASPGTAVIQEGKSRLFYFTATPGYIYSELLINGYPTTTHPKINADQTRATYQVNYAVSNQTLMALFIANPYPPLTITCTVATGNGTCTPSSAIVKKNYAKTFRYTPNTGYRIGSVTIGGIAKTPAISKTGAGSNTVKYATSQTMEIVVTYKAK